jgi:hypothetical protein
MNHIIHNYQDDILYYLEDIRQDAQKSPLYEDLEFQKAAFELSQFISEQIMKDGREIVNLMDLYIYIHERGLNDILNNQEISVAMKKTTNIMGKYLLTENSDMFSMIIDFYIRFQEADNKKQRYDYSLHHLSEKTDEQIIAFCLIYSFLSYEIERDLEWHKLDRIDYDEPEDLFSSTELSEFFSTQVIAFYNDNYDMIKAFLSEQHKEGQL